MRKITTIISALLIVASCAASCKSSKEKATESVAEEQYQLHVLTSFLPIYVFTLNVVKGAKDVKVDVLIPPEMGGPHGYEPTPADIAKIEKANIFIANGLDLEPFIAKLKAAKPGIDVFYATEGMEPLSDISAQSEVQASGFSGERIEENVGKNDTGNPHMWVSPIRAAIMVNKIAQALVNIDLRNADIYRANAKAYSLKLEQLGEEIRTSLNFVNNRNVVTMHNAFDYLARDSGFKIIAVLRADPLSEPSAQELARISTLIREQNVSAIFTEPQFSSKMAEVLSGETGVPIYELDPMHTGKPSLDLYETVMLKNLETLKTAMGESVK